MNDKTFTIELFSKGKTLLPGYVSKHTIDDQEYQYFIATLGKKDNSMVISVTKLDNNCNPDIFVSEGIHSFPDMDNN